MKISQEQIDSIPFQYAYSVQNGDIITGKRIKQAIARFFTWADQADQDGFYINHKAGMHIINFFHKFLKHTKGKSAGQQFILSPYQQFTLYNLFAWMEIKFNAAGDRVDTRRINEVYEKVAKKNGKTAVMAGVGLYCMAFDEEEGAEIYIGATKEDQAKLCFNQATEFVNASGVLQHIGFTTYQRTVRFKPENSNAVSFMRPLGGDSKTQDGINSSVSILDEYHAHKDDSVKENLESSMASRRQPIVYHITTAGVNLYSVCKHYEEVCETVLDGVNQNDHLLVMIHDLDVGDDWTDTNTWAKANPNLNVTVDNDFLKKEFLKVQNQPSKIPNFKTKHLNKWVDAPEIWIPSEIWQQNVVTVDDYEQLFYEKAKEFGCFTATDLSTRIDLSAHILLTEPDTDGDRYVLPYFFCPKDTIETRSKEDRVPYRLWMDQGHLTATPGNVIDYEYIKDKIRYTNDRYNIIHNEFDSWNATSTVNDLMAEGIENISYFEQGIRTINHPTKQFEILVYQGKIKHSGHPILEWNLSGCVIYQDANENIKVHKGNSNKGKKRVDGIIALIMALGASLTPEEESNESKYNDPETEINFGIPNDTTGN